MTLPFATSTLILAAALLLIFGAVIVAPLFDRKRPAVVPPGPLEALQRDRADIVRAIRELDFDHKTHKLSDADHRQLRTELVQRGTAILRDIDALAPAAATSSASTLDAQIENAIADLRAKRDKNARTCAACGAALARNSKFCGACGAEAKA